MTIEGELNTLVRAMVPPVANRVYPVTLPAAAVMPAIVYRRIPTGFSAASHSGAGGLETARMQFTVWAVDYMTARACAKLLKAGLHARSSPPFVASFMDGDIDLRDPDTAAFGVAVDVILWIKE